MPLIQPMHFSEILNSFRNSSALEIHCEEVSETLGLLLHNKYGTGKGSETFHLVFHKKATYCEEVSETHGFFIFPFSRYGKIDL